MRCRRLRIALVVIFCLLFQQVALAAYACTRSQAPPAPVAMADHCADLAMAQEHAPPLLCEKHCAPDQTLVVDHATLVVPPLALPPPAFGLVLAMPATHAVVPVEVPIARSDPPPRLRFCSLLI
jgi:hypothetical protein